MSGMITVNTRDELVATVGAGSMIVEVVDRMRARGFDVFAAPKIDVIHLQLVVDAFVETSVDNGATWQRMCDPHEDFRWFDGPWSIPHAIEVGRECWSTFLRITSGHVLTMGVHVRVIDRAGTVVEQWPKRPREAPRVVLHADHPGYLVSGVMSEP